MGATNRIPRTRRVTSALRKLARTLAAALLGDAHSFAARALDQAGLIRLRRVSAAPAPPSTDDDRALRIQVLARLDAQPTWHRDFCNVLVVDRTVVLQGLLDSSEDRVPARSIAIGTPGIKAVRDDRVRAHRPQRLD